MSQFKQVFSNDRIMEILDFLEAWEKDEQSSMLNLMDKLEGIQRKRAGLDIKIEALKQAPAVLRTSKEKIFHELRDSNRDIRKLYEEIHESKLIIKQIGIYRERIARCLR